MSTLNNTEIITRIANLVNEKAKEVSREEIIKYQEEHSNALIEQEVKDLITQRAISELMLRMCNFKPSPEGIPSNGLDSDLLDERFLAWYTNEEEARLRQMCKGNIGEELKKRAKPGDENLTFTEKFLRSVKERGKSGNTVDLLNNLKD